MNGSLYEQTTEVDDLSSLEVIQHVITRRLQVTLSRYNQRKKSDNNASNVQRQN